MQTYIQNTVNYARANQLAQTIYIFDADDESWKPAGVEQHWGLYTEGSRTPKFNFDIASYGNYLWNMQVDSSQSNFLTVALLHLELLI